MRASKGGLTHTEIMSLTWRQFWTYVDAFTFLLQEESEDGRRKNQRYDLRAMVADPRVKAWKDRLVAETKAKLARFNGKK